MNVCFGCGAYRADKIVDASASVAICPACGHREPFRMQPLLVVGGASGVGKSTVCRHIAPRASRAVVLETDILWRSEFNSPETHYRTYFEMWLRLAKNIGQAGRPAVLVGGGFSVPDNLEPCVERRYFSTVHYLALVCDDGVLSARLHARPAWRDSLGTIDQQLAFNRWLIAYRGEPAIELVETTNVDEETTAAAVLEWIEATLAA
jgi:predicted kinase